MDTGTNVKRLMQIDSLLKKGLSDEVMIMKSIYLELIDGLKQIKESIAPIDFQEEKQTAGISRAIDAFIKEMAPLERLNARFYDIKESSQELKEKLQAFKNTLGVYNSAKKAMIDFDNNIVYEFKVTIQRKFEQDIAFNKKVEDSLS